MYREYLNKFLNLAANHRNFVLLVHAPCPPSCRGFDRFHDNSTGQEEGHAYHISLRSGQGIDALPRQSNAIPLYNKSHLFKTGYGLNQILYPVPLVTSEVLLYGHHMPHVPGVINCYAPLGEKIPVSHLPGATSHLVSGPGHRNPGFDYRNCNMTFPLVINSPGWRIVVITPPYSSETKSTGPFRLCLNLVSPSSPSKQNIMAGNSILLVVIKPAPPRNVHTAS